MKISTKGIYAIEAMVDLAVYSGADNYESIRNIASRRNLSEKYLEQIIGALRRANLILSSRGAVGGYVLAKKPEEITVLEILAAVEKNLIPLECLHKQPECGVECEKCATREFWNGLWKNIEKVIMTVTLDQIIEKSKQYEQEQHEVLEYYI